MLLNVSRRSIAVVLALAATLTACSEDSTTEPEPQLGAPANIQVTVDGTSALVTFTPGANASSHQVIVSTPGESDRTQSVGATATEAMFTGLTEGATYTAQVRAIRGTDEALSTAAQFVIDVSVVFVTDDILTNTTWTSDKTYLLRGPIFVGSDCGISGNASGCVAATLTIEPGTTILGDINPPQGARGSFLVVSRGSRIIADANANEADKSVRPAPENVIVFTSSAPRGQRERGQWGGLVINGRAPTNAGAEALGEGESGLYGGTDPNDNSGILRGVRIEFAGDRVTATDELNGLAPQGVGAGTTIDYVQIHYNVDDGTEPFGGAPTMTHVVLTGIGDDGADGTDGYQGFMQFVIVQFRGDDGNHGVEFSTNADNPLTATPHSTAVFANFTIIGAASGELRTLGNASQGPGVNLREGSNYRGFNNIVANFPTNGLRFQSGGEVSAQNRLDGQTDVNTTLRFESNLFWGNTTDFNGTLEQTFFNTAAYNNMVVPTTTQLLPAEAYNVGTSSSPPNFVPSAMPAGYTPFDVSTLNNGAGLVMPTDGRTLVATNYAGAVAPGTSAADAWYAGGWTVWAADGSDSRPNQSGN